MNDPLIDDPGATLADRLDHALSAQYEAYPYPERKPADEARRLIVGSPSHLREIDYWVFEAKRARNRALEALVAGGGTGDGTIMLAEQLQTAGRPGHVTYLDRSAAAMAIARARSDARGLRNIVWKEGSLLDLPTSGLGPFDYIDCCGVLHHLADPLAGLDALLEVLAPGGGIGLMVYAPHGRTGVAMVQDALRVLAPVSEEPKERIVIAKRVLRHLPQTGWLRHNPFIGDHLEGGDAGIYDLLLNPRERTYTVPALAELLDRAGLRIATLIEPMRYDPMTWLPDPKLRQITARLSATEKAALAEALTGNMSAHVAYVVRKDQPIAPPDPMDDGAIPIMREISGPELAKHIRPDGTIAFLFDGLRTIVALPALTASILGLVDGKRTVGEIAAALASRGVSSASFHRAWRECFAALSGLNRLLLAPPEA